MVVQGSHLYVSAEGEFDIYKGNKFQRSFGPGIAFGEIALLYNTKRLRSINGKFINRYICLAKKGCHEYLIFSEEGWKSMGTRSIGVPHGDDEDGSGKIRGERPVSSTGIRSPKVTGTEGPPAC